MNVQDIVNRSVQIRQKYDQLNTKNNTNWEAEYFMSGFVGDVGDLSKLVMAKRGLRGPIDEDIDEKLAHELADCLWSVCILADKYNIDLEAAFLKTMNELDDRLNESLN
jgi:NTP pyrophosphatase (non-canonical NTP hydrolase)